MEYYSLHHKSPKVGFAEAVIRGIAPDKGLYFPSSFTPLPSRFFEEIGSIPDQEIAFTAIHQFVNEALSDNVLRDILDEVLDFPFPVVEIEEGLGSLELFHGPTMAFKDVGARFMARCLGRFSRDTEAQITVLVATSGDTGGAVANGFLGVEGINVVILYPSGKVSDIQERQLTTLGQNIVALEVNGSFDDCQAMVKRAFLDAKIMGKRQLTSANSINVARWLPQMFYFLFAYKQAVAHSAKIVFSVPSGNFGNLCAGMVAQRLGMPVTHFVAATNVNDTVPRFMHSGEYTPHATVATISNAMDVSDPSNFTRILELYGNDFGLLNKNLSSFAFTDTDTRNAIRHIYETTGYIADPHGAVGYLGLKSYMEKHPGLYGIFLETAHPVKFLDTVEDVIGKRLPLPAQIEKIMDRQKKSIRIADYKELSDYLMA